MEGAVKRTYNRENTMTRCLVPAVTVLALAGCGTGAATSGPTTVQPRQPILTPIPGVTTTERVLAFTRPPSIQSGFEISGGASRMWLCYPLTRASASGRSSARHGWSPG